MSLHTIVGWTLACILILVVGRTVYALFLSPYKNVPGPRMCKITRYWAVYHDMWLNRIDKIHEWHRQYGDVVLVAPGEVSFSNAALTKETYGTTGSHPKSRYFDNFMAYGERPIFCTLDVREHRQILKRTFAFYRSTNIFKPSMLRPVRANVRTLLQQLARETSVHATVDVLQRCNFFALDNITELLYGSHLGSRTLGNETCTGRTILAGWMDVEMWNNLSYNFPLVHKTYRTIMSHYTKNPDFLAAEDILADWNMRQIDTAIRDPDKMVVGSLLQLLCNAKSADGERLSKSWIAAELLDNIHAAQSTVALASMYCLWNLATVSCWQDRIRDEISALPLEEDGLPRFEDIQAAPILNACIRESSRLNPLSSGRAERVVPVAKAYNEVVLPAGTIVSTSTRAIQHRPDVFPYPEEYRPERWLEADESTLRVMDSCYMPFGYGARLCLGKPFALAEIKLLITGIMINFEVRTDIESGTTSWTMEQLGTQNALPRGQKCNLWLGRLKAADLVDFTAASELP